MRSNRPVIRLAREEDLPGIAALAGEALRSKELYPKPAEFEAAAKGESKGILFFTAHQGGRVVGSCSVNLSGEEPQVGHVFTTAQLRGKGIATRLYLHAFRHVFEKLKRKSIVLNINIADLERRQKARERFKALGADIVGGEFGHVRYTKEQYEKWRLEMSGRQW
ncbi:GNAT family N-acetyltransferase [Candidatus Micrarchaeota archaeon]|nr:GNAT family N-acetyltransferase [Candidatus Micrarchaeota archaeon]